jgi:hypothetical protein
VLVRKTLLTLSLLVGVLLAIDMCHIPFVPLSRPTLSPMPLTPTGPVGFTVKELHPGGKDLTSRLEDEAAKAAARGQRPILEFSAKW